MAEQFTCTMASSDSTLLLRKFAVGADLRIVDQQIDGYAPFLGEGKNLLRRGGVGEVCGQHLDLDAIRGAEFSAQLDKPLLPPCGEQEMCAARRKLRTAERRAGEESRS